MGDGEGEEKVMRWEGRGAKKGLLMVFALILSRGNTEMYCAYAFVAKGALKKATTSAVS